MIAITSIISSNEKPGACRFTLPLRSMQSVPARCALLLVLHVGVVILAVLTPIYDLTNVIG
jgi:hypothetical protein